MTLKKEWHLHTNDQIIDLFTYLGGSLSGKVGYMLVVNATADGFNLVAVPNLDGNSAHFLRGDGTLSALASGDIPNNAADTSGSAVYWKTSGTGKAALAGPATGQTRTYTGPDADTTLVGTTTVQTLTNKRITRRVQNADTSTQNDTITPDCDNYDDVKCVNTASASTTQFTIANPTGTPTDMQKMVIRIKTTNAQTLSWGNNYAVTDATPGALPTSLAAGKTIMLQFLYDSSNTKWGYVGYAGSF